MEAFPALFHELAWSARKHGGVIKHWRQIHAMKMHRCLRILMASTKFSFLLLWEDIQMDIMQKLNSTPRRFRGLPLESKWHKLQPPSKASCMEAKYFIMLPRFVLGHFWQWELSRELRKENCSFLQTWMSSKYVDFGKSWNWSISVECYICGTVKNNLLTNTRLKKRKIAHRLFPPLLILFLD